MTFYGQVKSGKLRLDNKAQWDKVLAKMPDCKVNLELKRRKNHRTLSQNALYWLWLEEISNYTGYYAEELHSSFKSMFLTDHSKKLPLVRSTTALNKAQFSLYLSKVEQKANELGITLMQPEDYINQGWVESK